MHFSIPDTRELTDRSGTTTFVTYNVNVNGLHHCLLRYRQLSTFHDQLKRTFPNIPIPSFPPKKFLPLGHSQLEDRRQQLEKYLQSISQNSSITSSDLFQRFFLSAQIESNLLTINEIVRGSNANSPPRRVAIPVYLSQGESFVIEVYNTDSTEIVLKSIANHLKLTLDLLAYFSLFVVEIDEESTVTAKEYSVPRIRLVRKLQSFERSFISIETLNHYRCRGNNIGQSKHVLTIRKSYFDISIDDLIMTKSEPGLNVIYHQTISDVEQGWLTLPEEMKRQLRYSGQSKRSKLELVKKCSKFYSYQHFDNCWSDYPEVSDNVTVSIGGRELVLRRRIQDNVEKSGSEHSFKITRIRCWRLTTIPPPKKYQSCPSTDDVPRDITDINSNSTTTSDLKQRLELSFEYLINPKDPTTLKWITIRSNHGSATSIMSMLLQSIVEEMLYKQKGPSGSQGTTSKSGVTSSSSHSSLSSSSPSSSSTMSSFSSGRGAIIRSSIKSIDRLSSCSSQESIGSSVTMASNNNSATIKFDARLQRRVDNEAFVGIGDDDL